MTTREVVSIRRFLSLVESKFGENVFVDRERRAICCKTPAETLALFNVFFVNNASERYYVNLTLRDEERRILVG